MNTTQPGIISFDSKDIGFWGNYDVIRNIKFKNKLLRKNKLSNSKIKTGVIFLGGGHKAVFLSGFALALQEFKLTKAIDFCLGISTGALAGYYFVGRRPKLGSSLIEDSVKRKLIYPKRYKIMDSEQIEKIIEKEKPINSSILKTSRTKLLIGLTDKKGDGFFIDASKVENPIKYVMASLSHPLVTAGIIPDISGQRLVDGCIGNPLPIEYAIKLGLTDILVVMTQPLTKDSEWFTLYGNSLVEKICKQLFYFNLGLSLRRRIHDYSKRYRNEKRYFTGEVQPPRGVRLAAIFPKNDFIDTFSTNKKLLQEAQRATKVFTEELFNKA